MFLLLLCSIASVTVIFLKIFTLRKRRILPSRLETKIDRYDEALELSQIEEFKAEFAKGRSSLARLCGVAVKNAHHSSNELQEAVQSSAREEIVKMNSGMSVLDVVITIAPLLGLLGTASGLVTVFGDIDDKSNIEGGIAKALSTTIVGISIAVPSVIAQSFFNRKIETLAVRLEVLMGQVVYACRQYAISKNKTTETL